MNINNFSLLFICASAIAMSGFVSANPIGVYKIAVITANVVDSGTERPSELKIDQLRGFLVRNGNNAKDIFGIDQFQGRICILVNNVSKIVDVDPCGTLLVSLPKYAEKKVAIRSPKVVYMEIPIDSLARSQK